MFSIFDYVKVQEIMVLDCEVLLNYINLVAGKSLEVVVPFPVPNARFYLHCLSLRLAASLSCQ